MEVTETTDSVFSLGNKLCRKLAIHDLEVTRGESGFANFVTETDKILFADSRVRKNKETFYSILLKKRNLATIKSYEMPLRDQVHAHSYEMFCRGEEESSKKLIEHLEQLEPLDSQINQILSFLLCLKDSGLSINQPTLSAIGDSIPGELSRKPRQEYPVFPTGVFTVGRQVGRQTTSGLSLYPTMTFTYPEDLAARSLLSLDTRLGLDMQGGRGEEGVEGEDEGYNSPIHFKEEAVDPTAIWDNIWEVDFPRRRTWEALGSNLVPKEPPFMAEAGPSTVHHLWTVVSENLRLVDPTLKLPSLRLTSPAQLTEDLGYLVAGIPSVSFSWEEGRFRMEPGTCLPGLSPECLASFCQTFLDTGSTVRRLEDSLLSSTLHHGPIMAGFLTGVRSFMTVYTNSVVNIAKLCRNSLGKLEQALRPLIHQMTFLGKLCLLDNDDPGVEVGEHGPDSVRLPQGVSLLSHLLTSSVPVSRKQVHLLLVALLRAAAAPYFRFLQDWLFSGQVELETDLSEFGLQIDPHSLAAEDHSHWDQAHLLVPVQGSSFLSDIQDQVHKTGKSLALLRRISPDHFMAGRFRHLHPQMKLAVSAAEQVELKSTSSMYESSLGDIAAEMSTSLAEKRTKAEEEKLEKLELLRKKNKEAARKYEEEKEMAKIEDKRKRKEQYADLKKQAELTQERKFKEKKEREEEEKKIALQAERMEERVRQREEEEILRIQEFYARLQADAELRERRVEWRMRRSDPVLKSKRQLLHKSINTTLETLKNNKTNESISNVTSVSEFDEMGNCRIPLEDHEGNVFSDSMGGSVSLSDTFKPELDNDDDYMSKTHRESLSSVSYSNHNVTSETDKLGVINNSNYTMFNKVNTRQENKAMVLGSNIQIDQSSPFLVSDNNGNFARDDEVDARKKSSSSQTPIERLLYPFRYNQQSEDQHFTPVKTEFVLGSLGKPVPYAKEFPAIHQDQLVEMGGPSPYSPPADGQAFAPLTLILQNSILVPLRVQTRLVDSALLNHLLMDCQLVDHFSALRKYMFLADGEFGRQLVLSLCQLGRSWDQVGEVAGQLFSHLTTGAPAPHHLSPAALNRALDGALASSETGATDSMSSRLTFQLDQTVGDTTRILGIPGLSLTYQPGWPCNIVLTPDSVKKYSSVLDFMVDLRLAMLSLELDWANENLVVRRNKGHDKAKLHTINLMRHEMIDFLRNLHAYVACQVLEVSWGEFQENLVGRVHNLDDLISVHEKYLFRVLFRCLLAPKAAPVMKIIRDIFKATSRFSVLVGSRFSGDNTESWDAILKQYEVFRNFSKFLYSVVGKLSARGYQPHLQDLLIRLNFNGFYD